MQNERVSHVLALVIIVAAIVAAYANAFNGKFLLDDRREIHEIATGGKLGSPSRPLVTLSLALDHKLHGENPAGYHAINILVHCAAALLLFGVVRRALLLPRYAGEFGAAATAIGFATSLLWAVHPLQTESVTYIVQRAESMMGMFYLLSLYCLARGAGTENRKGWHAAAIAAAILGGGTKQVIATLPVAALLYDRCFISGSFKAALKRAPGLYAGLCACWVVVAVGLWAEPEMKAVGFSMKKITPLDYARTQLGVITHYLKLCVWPVDLCFHYFWKIERTNEGAGLYGLFIGLLLGWTGRQIVLNTQAGFWAAWFFLILAPTSSIVPIVEPAVEHRLYLSLAGVCALFVLGLFWIVKRLGMDAKKIIAGVAVPLAIVLCLLTVQRNTVYADEIGMWKDVFEKRKGHDPLARMILGNDALNRKDFKTAREHFEYAKNIQADHQTLSKLGELELAEKHPAEAAKNFRKALESDPKHVPSLDGLFTAASMLNNRDEAFETMAKLAALFPNDVNLQGRYGKELMLRGKLPEAAQAYELALAAAKGTETAGLHDEFGSVLANLGQIPQALAEFEQAVKLDPKNASALHHRGSALELMRRPADAIESYRASLAINPNQAPALNALAWMLATSNDEKLRNGKEAVTLAEKAVQLSARKNPLMLDTLGAAYAENRQFEKALETLNSALDLVQAGSPLEKELKAHVTKFTEKTPLRGK